MSISNTGSQKLLWDFRHPIKGEEYDRALRSLVKPGIYTGLTAQILPANIIQFVAGHAALNTSYLANDSHFIHVHFQTGFDYTCPQTTPGEQEVIWLEFAYVEVEENWADVKHDSLSNFISLANANAVVLYAINYVAGVAVSLDDALRTRGMFNEDYNVVFEKPAIFYDNASPANPTNSSYGYLFKKTSSQGLWWKTAGSEKDLSAGGAGGGGFSTLVAGFADSLYKFISLTEFESDGTSSGGNTLVDPASTALDTIVNYRFSIVQKFVRTLNLIGSNFAHAPSILSRLNAVFKWAPSVGLQDEVSLVRVSRNGGLNWVEGNARQLGLKERTPSIMAEYSSTNQDSSYALDVSAQIILAQGFVVQEDAVAKSASLNLLRVGTPGGRFRVTVRTDSSTLPSVTDVIAYSDWMRIDDVTSAAFTDTDIAFKVEAFLTAGTQYHLALELENVDEYNFSATVRELQWGVDASASTYTDGDASTGDGVAFTGIVGVDFCFNLYAGKVFAKPTADVSDCEVVFSREIHTQRGTLLIDYPSSNADSATDLNATTQQELAQQFKLARPFSVKQIDLDVIRTGSPGGQLEAYIYADASGVPGTILATSLNKINANAVAVTEEYRTFKFDNVDLDADTTYWVVLKGVSSYAYSGSNKIQLRTDGSTSTYLSGLGIGAKYNGATWSTIAASTFIFMVKGAYQDQAILDSFDAINDSTNQIDIDDGTAREKIAQAFIPDCDSVVERIELLMLKLGAPGGDAYVEIRSNSAGEPGTLLATSEKLDIATELPNSQGNVNFIFAQPVHLLKATTYWMCLVADNGYTYTDGVNEIEWYRDPTSPVHAGGASSSLATAVWTPSTSVQVYTIFGVEAHLLIEVYGRKLNTELNGIGAWYGFEEPFVEEQNVQVVSLTPSMIATGDVPLGGMNLSGAAVLAQGDDRTLFVPGTDYLPLEDVLHFTPGTLIGLNSLTVQKLERSIVYRNPSLEINDKLRNYPHPIITKGDTETLLFSSSGGAGAWRMELPDGTCLIGLDGAQVSFNAGKNKFGGLGLDTGAEASNTEYFVYITKRAGSYRDAAITISASPPPTGPLNIGIWVCVASFTNNSASDIGLLMTQAGPGGIITSEWTTYALVPDATTTAPTKATTPSFDIAQRRRVGSELEFRWLYKHTSATGTTDGSGTYLFPITDDGLIIDVGIIPYSSSINESFVMGTAYIVDATVTFYHGLAIAYDQNQIYIRFVQGGGTSAYGDSFIAFSGATVKLSMKGSVPITNWKESRF